MSHPHEPMLCMYLSKHQFRASPPAPSGAKEEAGIYGAAPRRPIQASLSGRTQSAPNLHFACGMPDTERRWPRGGEGMEGCRGLTAHGFESSTPFPRSFFTVAASHLSSSTSIQLSPSLTRWTKHWPVQKCNQSPVTNADQHRKTSSVICCFPRWIKFPLGRKQLF
ncbi:hypothetical protein BGZ63DRAFT_193097 [Mariannaea sp. PMI_226]|nr:hypothetical protein BGZ63DRAFT_193097 [Mariannaea sp. PMI_226]